MSASKEAQEIEHLRKMLVEAYHRLKDVNGCFNMARLIMSDQQLRTEAGDMVRENKELLGRVEQTLLLKPEFRTP